MILKGFNFFDIFIEFNWGVFSYWYLCFKVNVIYINLNLRNINKCARPGLSGIGGRNTKLNWFWLILDARSYATAQQLGHLGGWLLTIVLRYSAIVKAQWHLFGIKRYKREWNLTPLPQNHDPLPLKPSPSISLSPSLWFHFLPPPFLPFFSIIPTPFFGPNSIDNP